MHRLALVAVLAALASTPAAAQDFANMVGTWKGDSESIVFSGGNTHHPGKSAGLRMSSVPFTMVIDKQDGRRFSGTFSSAKHKETVIAVISRNGAIYMVDDDGYSVGTLLSPTKLELCYMKRAPDGRVASCTEMTKQ
jgi:opacity protein-like surface antigen